MSDVKQVLSSIMEEIAIKNQADFDLGKIRLPKIEKGKDSKFTLTVGSWVEVVSDKAIRKVGTVYQIKEVYKENGYNRYIVNDGSSFREGELALTDRAKIKKYNRTMKVTNLESMSKGSGANYLLCLIAHNGDYIAHSWKRKIPAIIQDGYILLDFTK